MSEKTVDRRIRKTQKAIKEGFATLMMKKNIRDISVRELAELVDLNRATFYLHYQDIYDLQQHIEDEAINEVRTMLDAYFPLKTGERPYPLLVGLLNYVNENKEQCKMLLSANSGGSFLSKMSAVLSEKCLQNWLDNFHIKSNHQNVEYFNDFLISGYIAIIKRWLDSGSNISPEKFAQMMENMAVHGIEFLNMEKLQLDNAKR